jgi:hypothetical protein
VEDKPPRYRPSYEDMQTIAGQVATLLNLSGPRTPPGLEMATSRGEQWAREHNMFVRGALRGIPLLIDVGMPDGAHGGWPVGTGTALLRLYDLAARLVEKWELDSSQLPPFALILSDEDYEVLTWAMRHLETGLGMAERERAKDRPDTTVVQAPAAFDPERLDTYIDALTEFIDRAEIVAGIPEGTRQDFQGNDVRVAAWKAVEAYLGLGMTPERIASPDPTVIGIVTAHGGIITALGRSGIPIMEPEACTPEALESIPFTFRISPEEIASLKAAVQYLRLGRRQMKIAPLLEIGESGGKPKIRGKEVKPLNANRYAVVKALWDAGPDGLGLEDLKKKSDVERPDKLLRKLVEVRQEWAEVISLPGQSYGRYRIRAEFFPKNAGPCQ